MVMIDVGDPKMAREMLCEVEHLILHSQTGHPENYRARIDRMIREIDRHRPLGPDGKHGNRHTRTCGCPDIVVRQHQRYIAMCVISAALSLVTVIVAVITNTWYLLIPFWVFGMGYVYFFRKLTKERW